MERKNGKCPHCGHDCEDEYIGVKVRLINEKYYDTVKCTRCNRIFDRVYNMVFVQSEPTRSTQELLKGRK